MLTCLFSASQFTSAPSDSAINLSGTSVRDFAITGGQSTAHSTPFIFAVVLPMKSSAVVSLHTIETQEVSTFHVTVAPSFSKTPLTGTKTLPFSIIGFTSNEIVSPFTLTVKGKTLAYTGNASTNAVMTVAMIFLNIIILSLK